MRSFYRNALAAALALTLGASSASADVISYFVDIPNPAISGFPGPYEQVTVNRTSSTTANITFTSLTKSGNIYLMGGDSAASVNVNATSWTVSNIAGSNAGTGFTPGPLSDGGSGGGAGGTIGTFNQSINSFDGFTHALDTISFTLTDTSGTWASAANVLAPNSQGNVVGAHIFVTSSPANAANGAINTGFGGGHTVVPEPGPLLGAGVVTLMGLVYTWRRRRRATA
jgi:hypothetical protein